MNKNWNWRKQPPTGGQTARTRLKTIFKHFSGLYPILGFQCNLLLHFFQNLPDVDIHTNRFGEILWKKFIA